MSSTQQDRRYGAAERSIDGKHMVRTYWDPEHGTCAERFLDDQDQAIVDERMAALDLEDGPRVGDFVQFANGTERRISHEWPAGDHYPASVQTSEGGSFYLGLGYLSYSGSLHPGVSIETLTDTGETKSGKAWIFHHDSHRKENGVDFGATFRVFRCSLTPDEAELAFSREICS